MLTLELLATSSSFVTITMFVADICVIFCDRKLKSLDLLSLSLRRLCQFRGVCPCLSFYAMIPFLTLSLSLTKDLLSGTWGEGEDIQHFIVLERC